MAKKKSKSDIIAAYVAKYPDATWRDAEPSLARRGISSGYFASQRSKLKAGAASPTGAEDAEGGETPAAEPTESPVKKKRGPKKGSKRAAPAAATNSNLTDAVEFARKAGGLDEAQALLNELARMQI